MEDIEQLVDEHLYEVQNDIMNSIADQVLGQMEPIEFDMPLVEIDANYVDEDLLNDADINEILENVNDPFGHIDVPKDETNKMQPNMIIEAIQMMKEIEEPD